MPHATWVSSPYTYASSTIFGRSLLSWYVVNLVYVYFVAFTEPFKVSENPESSVVCSNPSVTVSHHRHRGQACKCRPETIQRQKCTQGILTQLIRALQCINTVKTMYIWGLIHKDSLVTKVRYRKLAINDTLYDRCMNVIVTLIEKGKTIDHLFLRFFNPFEYICS